MNKDAVLLRGFARRVMEIATCDEMNRRRELWRRHNSLKRGAPPVHVRAYAAKEVPFINELSCEGELARQIEQFLRDRIYRFEHFRDDYIIEPWYVQRATFAYPADAALRWGPRIAVTRPQEERGAFIFSPPLREEADFSQMVEPRHEIDEAQSAHTFDRACELLGGDMPVYLDRAPYYRLWQADISTDLAYLRGLEAMMWDMCDRPEWLHKLVSFMQQGVLKANQQAEDAGDYSFLNHDNQAMPYASELRDPGPGNSTRDQLWVFVASQEFHTISPSMWEEFLLRYQAPIMEKFALSAYGCCEDLTRKIPYLKKHVRNLRRVAVTPWADTRASAEAIGSDYVLSWRPSPADMVAVNFDPERVRRVTREAFAVFKDCGSIVDITLKDVETVSHNHNAVPGWVDCVREVISEGGWE